MAQTTLHIWGLSWPPATSTPPPVYITAHCKRTFSCLQPEPQLIGTLFVATGQTKFTRSMGRTSCLSANPGLSAGFKQEWRWCPAHLDCHRYHVAGMIKHFPHIELSAVRSGDMAGQQSDREWLERMHRCIVQWEWLRWKRSPPQPWLHPRPL